MTNQLTQAELLNVLEEAFQYICDCDDDVSRTGWLTDDLYATIHKVKDSKFAQLIQQRQWEPVYQNLVLLAPTKYGWVDVDEARFNSFPGVKRTLYTQSQLVAQALEKAAKECERISDEYYDREGMKYAELKTDAATGANECASAIRALIEQPVDHIVDANKMVEQAR